jgi:hypothetical protein
MAFKFVSLFTPAFFFLDRIYIRSVTLFLGNSGRSHLAAILDLRHRCRKVFRAFLLKVFS